jgi:hypothetical protein
MVFAAPPPSDFDRVVLPDEPYDWARDASWWDNNDPSIVETWETQDARRTENSVMRMTLDNSKGAK